VDPVKYLKEQDGLLNNLIDYVVDSGHVTMIGRGESDYESLVRSIVGQQVSTASARATFGRLLAAAGDSGITPKSVASMTFEELRSTGLSGSKTSYIQGLGQAVLNREIDLSSLYSKSDEEVVAELQHLRGVGRWTAEMFLIFQMESEDIFPLSDGGIRSATTKLYSLPKDTTNATLLEIAEKWRPYRSLATRFLWGGLNAGYFA
jgi:DNA-3-methyladenine glycosylase II